MSRDLNSYIINHLTTTLLSLEIDVAQLETKIFLLFNDLRDLYISSVDNNDRSEATTPGPATKAPGIPPPASVIQSHALRVLDEITRAEKMEDEIFETVTSVRMQLQECTIDETRWEETDLGEQTRGVMNDLERVCASRRKLEDWADEIYFGCHFNEMVGEDCSGVIRGPAAKMFMKRGDSLKLIVGRPLSLLARCPSQNSILTIPRPYSRMTVNDKGQREEEEDDDEEEVEEPPPVPPKNFLRSLVPPSPLRFHSTASRASRTNVSSISSMSESTTSNMSTRSSNSFTKMPPTPNTPGTMGWDIAELPGPAITPPTPNTPGTMGWDINELPGTEVTWDDVNHKKGETFAIRHVRSSAVIMSEPPLAPTDPNISLHLSVTCNTTGNTPEPPRTYPEPKIELLQCPPRGSMYQSRDSINIFQALTMDEDDREEFERAVKGENKPIALQNPPRAILKKKRKSNIELNSPRPPHAACMRGQDKDTNIAVDSLYEAKEQQRLSRARFSLKRTSAIFSPNPKLYVSRSEVST